MIISRNDREHIFKKVCQFVREKHFNTAFSGANWDDLVTQRTSEILESAEAEEFEKNIQKLLVELRTSHTGFFHTSRRPMPARNAINATFQQCLIGRESRWVFQDVHEGGAAYVAGIRSGDILLAVNDVQVFPPDVVLFQMGNCSVVTVRRPTGVSNRMQIQIPSPKNSKHPVNVPLAVSSRVLDGSIAYLKVAMFPGRIGIDFAKSINAVMKEFDSCERMIIDVRGNTGGGIGGLRLMSCLTPEKRPIGYSLTRRRAESGYHREELRRFDKIPSSKAALPWLIVKYAFGDKSICLYTEGLGARRYHGRVVILVNEHSASAAEMLAAFAVENRLAKIVGTRTAGRLLSGSAFNVGHGYTLGLPTAAYLTWSGQSLEGVGILPDVEIGTTYESLAAGSDVQLHKAVETVRQM